MREIIAFVVGVFVILVIALFAISIPEVVLLNGHFDVVWIAGTALAATAFLVVAALLTVVVLFVLNIE